MKKTIKLTAGALALAGVVGCKMNLTADLYSSDLFDAAAGADDLTTSATMAFQVPSTEDCDEHTAEIAELMAGVVEDFSPKGCESVEMESFLLADTQIPILTESAWAGADSLFGIAFDTEDETIGAALVMNRQKYAILTSRMKAKFHQTVNLAESKVKVVLTNDLREPVLFAVVGAFVNGEPSLAKTTHELRRRHNAEIVFSDVATANLAKHGLASVIALRQQP